MLFNVSVSPPPEALVHAQDKLVMRRRLSALGAPVPRFSEVSTVEDAVEAIEQTLGLADTVLEGMAEIYEARATATR